MKKQFLFLILFVAALVAGTTSAFAQYQTAPTGNAFCKTPTTLSGCTTVDALHPIQGENYTYSVDNTPANATIRWFVINNVDLTTASDSIISIADGILPIASSYIDATDGAGAYDITGSSFLYSVTDGTNTYNLGTTTATSIEMAWKYFDGINNQVLLVAYIESDPVCTDNIAVWRIIPEPAFTIDIAVLDDAGDSIAPAQSTDAGECVSPIEFAIYDPTAGTIDAGTTPGDLLTVDYGENWVFFVVNGANYFDSWLPEFQFGYSGGDVPATFEASWAYLADATSTDPLVWNDLSGTLAAANSTFSSSVPVIAGASYSSPGTIGAGVTPATGGECIVVRARLDWGTDIEHDQVDGVLHFAANGIAYDGDNGGGTDLDYYSDRTNFEDLHHADCSIDGFDNDWVDYNITPRPQIENGTPTQEIKTGQGVN